MKRSLFIALCLSVVAAFAGPYDIAEFDAPDVGTPDDVIAAEFDGQLKTATVEDVEALQEGRIVVRQKFSDPFGDQPTSYQLYQGSAGDLSSMTAMSAPEGTSYSDLVKAKFYSRRGAPANEDIDKVYFDGKSIYVPGAAMVFAFVNSTPVTIKGEGDVAPAPAAAPAAKVEDDDEEECDEDDEECEEEEDDEDVDVAGNLDESNEYADERDDAAYEAGENALDRFGIADEVRFWSAVGLTAVAVGSAIMGVVQHMKSNEAKAAYDDLSDVEDQLLAEVDAACNYDGKCREAMIQKADLGNGYTLAELNSRKSTNKKTQDSYATARNIWFAVTGVSLTAAIVLYVW